jgi:Flp pilus assembly protein TadB
VLVIPVPASVVVAAAVAGVLWRVLPEHLSRVEADAKLAVSRALPEACSLLAGLLRTGCTDSDALARTAAVIDGPLCETLTVAAQMRRLGATATEAWRASGDDPGVRSLATVLARRGESGASVAAELDRLASDLRSDYFTHAQAAARTAAVRSVIPLAVCFLPAFLLVGVAPIVAALAAGLPW